MRSTCRRRQLALSNFRIVKCHQPRRRHHPSPDAAPGTTWQGHATSLSKDRTAAIRLTISQEFRKPFRRQAMLYGCTATIPRQNGRLSSCASRGRVRKLLTILTNLLRDSPHQRTKARHRSDAGPFFVCRSCPRGIRRHIRYFGFSRLNSSASSRC